MGKQSKTKQQRRINPGPTDGSAYVLTDEAPTSATSWKRRSTNNAVRLPSGNVARVKRVGPEAFMESDIMPDMLAPIVQKAIHEKRGLPPRALDKMLAKPEMLGQMVEMMDRLCCYAVIEPSVQMPPGCVTCGGLDSANNRAMHEDSGHPEYHKFEEGPRDETVLYADDVDFEDKVFIMNYAVGGSSDLERFRDEHTEAVGSMDAQPGVEGPAI